MLLQMLVGSLVISLTIVIEVTFIFAAIYLLSHHHITKFLGSEFLALVLTLTFVALWLLGAFSLSTWLWAFTFISLDCFSSFEEALYFSMVAFTSLGFGDVILPSEWRLLSGPIVANGLILFGLNTAFLIETLRRILEAHKKL